MKTVGSIIRAARENRGTLRALAQQLDISAAYLSDIELDRRVPSEDTLLRIASVLDLDFNDLMALSGRLGDYTEHYMQTHPIAIKLLRAIAAENLDERQLATLLNLVQQSEML
jgi:transcriptional regulator with XRE-family HTH domain